MKKILLSSLILGVSIAYCVAGTYAWLGYVEIDNGVPSYTFCLNENLRVIECTYDAPYPHGINFPFDDEYGNNLTALITVDNLLSGDTDWVRVHLDNNGSDDGVAYITFDNVLDYPGETIEEEIPDFGELSEYLIIDVYYGDESEYPIYQNHVVDGEVLRDINGQAFALGDLPHDNGMDVAVYWELLPEADNAIWGDSVSFEIVFGLDIE